MKHAVAEAPSTEAIDRMCHRYSSSNDGDEVASPNTGETATVRAASNYWPWCVPVVVTGLGDACCNCMAADGGGICSVSETSACGCFLLPARCGNVCECALCAYFDIGYDFSDVQSGANRVNCCSLRRGAHVLHDGTHVLDTAALCGHGFVRPAERPTSGAYVGMDEVNAGAAISAHNKSGLREWVRRWTCSHVAQPTWSLCWYQWSRC